MKNIETTKEANGYQIDNGICTIPVGTCIIESGFFRNRTELQHVIIPDTVTVIAPEAFSGCVNLTEVELPDSLTTIGQWAFYGCTGLKTIHIPASVRKIGHEAFAECSNLVGITVDNKNTAFDSREDSNAIITRDANVLVAGCAATRIPQTVSEIGACAFVGHSSLGSIDIPASVNKIGSWAFYGCKALETVSMQKNTAVGHGVFFGTKKKAKEDEEKAREKIAQLRKKV